MPIYLLAIYIALLFIRPMDWWEPVLGWELVNATAIITLLVCLPRILESRPLFQQVPHLKWSLALLAGVTFSWLGGFYFGGMMAAFQEFGKVIVLYCLIILIVRTPHDFRIILWTVLLCVVWMAIHGGMQVRTGVGFGNLEPLMRKINENGDTVPQILAFGTFSDPNDLCLVFIIAVPLLLACYRAIPNPLLKTFPLALIPLMFYGAYLTNSRGGIVGLLGMIGAYGIARSKGWRRWFLISAGVTFVFVLAPARFATGLEIDTSRTVLWGDGLAMFKANPIFGIGRGAFADYSSGSQVAHNSYIHALAELGLLGYVPFFMLIYLTMLHLRRAMNLKEIKGSPQQFMLSGLFSALVGYLTALYFLTRTYNHVLYIMLALAIAQVLITYQGSILYEKVFGSLKQDTRQGLIWCGASIPFLWITVRLANALSGS